MTADRIFAEDGPKYRARGWSVFPVRGKIPCEPWQPWQQEPPHPDQIAAWCEKYPDANIGLATGKVSGIVVIDVDGEEGVASARALDLPKQTPVAKTGRGWHVYLAHPGDGVRIGNRAGLRPHIDVRGDGGYVVIPRSLHESGRRYEWIQGPDEFPLAPIPSRLLQLLLSPEPSPSNGGAPAGQPIPKGERNYRLWRLGRGLLAKGLSPAAMKAALQAENLARCQPPLSESEIRELLEHVETQPNRPGFVPAAEIAEAKPLQVPEAGMLGLARDFATLYASHLEAPASFFYFTYLTYLGALLSRQITLVSALDIEPRLYTVLLGESSDTRKTTALRKTDQFFRSLAGWEPTVLLGAGSGEGLAKALQESPELLLHYDELKAFVSKAQAESSVLLPMVGSLFERHEFDNRTKDGSISVRGASLSLVAACTQDTYATMFDRRFHAIGFLNRLWLVADRTTTQIAVPPPIRPDVLDRLREQTVSLLKDIQGRYRQKNYQRVEFGLTKGAEAMFTAWYLQRQGTIFEKRLETYGHRLMLLLAAMAGKDEVDEEITTAVVALLKYQLDARRECDPVDAENTVAILEERIRRTLARGAMNGREIRRRLHPERVGIWLWNTAVENLRHGSGELRWDRKTDMYSLIGEPGVTTAVTRPQTGSKPW